MQRAFSSGNNKEGKGKKCGSKKDGAFRKFFDFFKKGRDFRKFFDFKKDGDRKSKAVGLVVMGEVYDGLKQTLRLLLMDGFQHDDPDITAFVKELSEKMPTMFGSMLPADAPKLTWLSANLRWPRRDQGVIRQESGGSSCVSV
ncbi:hypothetical protein GGR56DRAFT_675426 [Xylariaceae sp. FL0804]|nr:hypothetical protein GGR56DRAFT_675426 [Xylariaceae sp. FL0804]